MGIMGFLRNRAGVILVVVIGFAMFAFVVGDAIRMGSPFWAANRNVVGKVDGEKIDIQYFNDKVEQNTNNFKQQMGQSSLNPQMTAYIIQNTWNQQVAQMLMDKEAARLGLQVSKNELNDMITGKNPSPQVVQSFGDPQTGQINRQQLNAFLSNIQTQDPASPIRQQWGGFLASLKQERLSQKYDNLIKNSIYVTSLEAQEDYSERKKLADFSYVNLEYASIPDNKVQISDQDYEAYYEENKESFKNPEETRSFDYVVFDATPSKADSAAVKEKVNNIAADFRASKNDSLFVSINSDTKAPISYVKKGQLEPALDSLVFNASEGEVVGPVFNNGVYKIAKVLDIRNSPDSVTASHILINPAAEGGLDKAKAKADSLANLIRNGASFADLAKKYGTDASKEKGGDLGTFSRGAMIPAFEEAVFNGKTGDIKVITTQYGVHVIRIDAQKGSSRVAKVAVIDKALTSSNETEQQAYAKATSFLSKVKTAADFDKEVQKEGLRKLTAENITGSQPVAGLEGARELVRWAFKADEGDISDQVFEGEDKYIVAKLSDIREEGTLPLEKVKKEIEPAVRNRVKAHMLSEKFADALNGAKTLDQVAKKVQRTVTPVQNVVFANPIIPGVAQENKVIGTVFGLEAGKLSKPIEGERGVYVVSVNHFTNPEPLTNVYKQKEQMLQFMDQRIQGSAFQALRDNADIKDNRVRFF